jgi:DNA-binding NarL/FixJ family response regulator
MTDRRSSRLEILICDDHELFCQGLKEVLRQHLPDAYISTSNNTDQCLSILSQRRIDILICDLKIGPENGLQLIEQNAELLKDINIVLLSGLYEEYLLNKARAIGVNYFLKKEACIDELLPAINGESAFKLKASICKSTDLPLFEFLSKKEKEIIKLVTSGLQSKEIAEKLCISKTTVDTHRRNIHRKLKTSNTGDLLRLVYEGVLEL